MMKFIFALLMTTVGIQAQSVLWSRLNPTLFTTNSFKLGPLHQPRITLTNYVLSTSTSDLPVATVNVSGVTYSPVTGTIFVAMNSSTAMYEYTIHGAHLRTITLTGFSDTEGICWMYGTKFALSQESTSSTEIYIFDIDSSTTAITNTACTQINTDITVNSNNGLEGITYDSDNNWFYVAVEKQSGGGNGGRVFKVTMAGAGTEYGTLGTNLLAGGYNDLADIYYERESGHVFLIAQEQNTIIEATLAGTIVNTRATDSLFSQPEGIGFSPDGRYMFVVGENDDMGFYMRNDLNTAPVSLGTIYATGITNNALTASRAVVSGADKTVISATTTAAEIGYVNGVTSSIQTQLNARVLKAGDTMTGTLTVTGMTNSALTASLPVWSGADKTIVSKSVLDAKRALGIDAGSATASADGTVTNTFNVTFSSAPIVVTTPVDATGAILTNAVHTITTTTCIINVGSSGATVNWIAVGAP